MAENIDACIDAHFLDADVFVLVLSAECTLSKGVSLSQIKKTKLTKIKIKKRPYIIGLKHCPNY